VEIWLESIVPLDVPLEIVGTVGSKPPEIMLVAD
jgi:hypothetical protein